jgi:hypothetical protein
MTLDKAQMQAIIAPHATVSDKIRALDAAGVPRAQIATFLGKRYQHVRNVLMHAPPKGSPFGLGRADVSGVREEPAKPYDATIDEPTVRLAVGEDGSVVLPPRVIEALGVRPGGVIIAELGDKGLMLFTLMESVRRVQAMVRAIIPPGRNLVDELIADRREEAEREARDG